MQLGRLSQITCAAGSFIVTGLFTLNSYATSKPNIVIIYADDLGYGDVSCYGATKIETPNVDELAKNGIRFTNAHASSATCTPSRYSLLTGEYAWRKKNTHIANGDASLIIPTDIETLPLMLQKAGYTTAAVGKWHLGLGPQGGPDWNGVAKPGAAEIGLNYSFLIPATGDRVPCVFVENGRVAGLDPKDPIKVSYKGPIGDEPTGKDHPELLKMMFSYGHDQGIVNGISRIGYMTGGKSALWDDENIAQVLTKKAETFIEENKDHPFFLYFATHDVHVPRVPSQRFVGKSDMGPRGDAILQFDWSAGEIIRTLHRLGLTENTLVILTSDNGPVLDDGYSDQAVEKLGGHKPAGPMRGGKYSAFDAGTRVPFIVSWPSEIKPGTSDALVSQIDLFASYASLVGQKLSPKDAPDSYDVLPALLGKSDKARDFLVEHSRALSIIEGNWKYIVPNNSPAVKVKTVPIELGNAPYPQLYDLSVDLGEKNNLAEKYPEKVKELADLLEAVEQGKYNRKQ